jgi:hypothetical protein
MYYHMPILGGSLEVLHSLKGEWMVPDRSLAVKLRV